MANLVQSVGAQPARAAAWSGGVELDRAFRCYDSRDSTASVRALSNLEAEA